MQWLIDMAIEAMEQYLIDNPRFVDRGDPAAFDFLIGNFTKDGAWHDLDLSAIIPANAQAVLFAINIRNTFVVQSAQFRKDGNANVRNITQLWTQVANVPFSVDAVCPLSTDRKIEYVFGAAGWLTIDFTVKGWWL